MTSPRETVLCQYHYDPLDRLTSHALPDSPERQRFYCKSRLATEIQGAMRYSIVQHGEQLLAQQRGEDGAPDTTLLATDQQRSVLQALKVDHLPQPIAYSPYGHRTGENGLLSLLGFNGERPDPVTGCYLLGNGYRAFNPVLMRFNSPDSLSPFDKGGFNAYAYCSGDPRNSRDPTGHAGIFGVFNFADSLFDTIPRTKILSSRTTASKMLSKMNTGKVKTPTTYPEVKPSIPDDNNYLIGYHTTTKSEAPNLISNRLTSNYEDPPPSRNQGIKGFHSADYYESYGYRHSHYAAYKNAGLSYPGTETLGVYVKDLPLKKAGVDFTPIFNREARGGDSKNAGIVIHPHMYDDVSFRKVDPRRLPAPWANSVFMNKIRKK